MPRKPNLLNVKVHIERTNEALSEALKDSASGKYGWKLPPIYEQEFREICFFGRAILRKHAEKKTRKDLYVEAKGFNK